MAVSQRRREEGRLCLLVREAEVPAQVQLHLVDAQFGRELAESWHPNLKSQPAERAQEFPVGRSQVGAAWSFAALDVPDREVLMTPFIEEVFDHEPREATLTMKAAVAVVVRNSLALASA